MTTAFDPKLSYLNDWRYHDFIENGDYQPPTTGSESPSQQAFALKVKRLDATDSGFEPIALALGLAAESTVLLVWPRLDSEGKLIPFDPKVNGAMVLADATWTIDNVRKNRFGHYEMGVTKATSNAEP